jgi:hypothetical protein
MSKALAKFAAKYATDKFPNVGKYINPDGIVVEVTDDELASLEQMNLTYTPNVVVIVAKNIAFGLFGDLVNNLKESMTTTDVPEALKIKITDTIATIPPVITIPTTITVNKNIISAEEEEEEEEIILDKEVEELIPEKVALGIKRKRDVDKNDDIYNAKKEKMTDEQSLLPNSPISVALNDELHSAAEDEEEEDKYDDDEEDQFLLAVQTASTTNNLLTSSVHIDDRQYSKFLDIIAPLNSSSSPSPLTSDI